MSDVSYGKAVLVLGLHCRFLTYNCVPISESQYSQTESAPTSLQT